jgi:membrane protein implicated in regulation of membrane protease activity
METVFLACFIFGALFTTLSVIVGQIHISAPGVDVGHFGHLGHGGHPGHAAGHHGASVARGHAAGQAMARNGRPARMAGLPLFNVSSLLAFLTWFGAAGYVLMRFAAWPAAAATAGALVAGAAGALLIALFLAKVMAGEREMDPRDYRLNGTIARVTAGVPANGVGEIVFTKVGSRRSEAARSYTGRPIPRDTEVVVIDYQHGVALVQPWDELMAGTAAEQEREG